jgi:hypothetical protein
MKTVWFVKRIVLCGIMLLGGWLTSVWAVQPVQAAIGPCSLTNIHQGLITADESWCAGGDAHYLFDDVIVQPGVTLTIQAGVTVASPSGAGWKYLIIKGHLDVNGTNAQPVLMNGPLPGGWTEWGGLFFDGSAGDGSGNINYATIEHAGANLGGFNPPHAVLIKDLGVGKAVNISHSTIQNNPVKGVYVVNSTVNFTNNTFSHNTYPIYIDGESSVVSYSGNTFVDNAFGYPNVNYKIAEDAIFIGSDALTAHDFSLPVQTGLDAYVFPAGTTLPAGRTMTVAPGVLVRTGTGSLIVKGALIAAGSSGLPIRFTGIPVSGSTNGEMYTWFGLAYDGRDGGGSGHLTYVTIDHAADNVVEYGPYALLVRDTPGAIQVLVENCIIQDNPDIGVRVVNGNLTLNASTIQRNRRAMLIAGVSSQVPLSGNTFTDNLYNYVYIDAGAMTGHNINLSLQTGLNAYYFTSTFTVPNGKTLTIQPGVVVRTADAHFLIIQGDLQAVGTPAQPVRFGDLDTGGNRWGGLIFDGPAGASGRVEHAIIERGCAFWNGKDCANVLIYNLLLNKSVVVEHSTVVNSAGTGLSVFNSPTAQIDNNLIQGCRNGVYLFSNLVIKNLAILDTVLDGVIIEAGASVDARHLTIARAGRSGFYVRSGGEGQLRNSVLSQNTLAVWAEGTGTANLDTNLSDANISFKSGTVTDLHTINGAAMFAVDGYHILSTSAAVGKGLTMLASSDIDGESRSWPACSLPDLGVDEIADGSYCVYIPALRR